ncbi:methionine biosynthesis protein MetW [Pseudomonadales bacterium]|nr:methionine biosynthesis protein MetW [Pseudomonadales bacterium]
MRGDLALIATLINPGARVLDLGCGEGELLDHLQRDKRVNGYGLDRDAENIRTCVSKGVNVIEQDLDEGLANFVDASFDMVVMTDALQAVKEPRELVRDMLRIGEECIVTFPNFAHWRCRAQLALKGVMPVSKQLPHNWFDTPNIHLCTFTDFEQLCAAESINIIQRRVVNANHQEKTFINWAPNFFGTYAFYRLGKSS